MLEKTKGTNEKILNMKSKTNGGFYTTPEQLSAAISEQSREKKVEEA